MAFNLFSTINTEFHVLKFSNTEFEISVLRHGRVCDTYEIFSSMDLDLFFDLEECPKDLYSFLMNNYFEQTLIATEMVYLQKTLSGR